MSSGKLFLLVSHACKFIVNVLEGKIGIPVPSAVLIPSHEQRRAAFPKISRIKKLVWQRPEGTAQLCLHHLTPTYCIVKHLLSLSCKGLKEKWWRNRRKAVSLSLTCLSTAVSEKEGWQPDPCSIISGCLLTSVMFLLILHLSEGRAADIIFGQWLLSWIWSSAHQKNPLRAIRASVSGQLMVKATWRGGQWVPARGHHPQVSCSCQLLSQEP